MNRPNILPRIRRGTTEGLPWGKLSAEERDMVSPNVLTRARAYAAALPRYGAMQRDMSAEEIALCIRKVDTYVGLHGAGKRAHRAAAHSIYTDAYLRMLDQPTSALALMREAIAMMEAAGAVVLHGYSPETTKPRTKPERVHDPRPDAFAQADDTPPADLSAALSEMLSEL